MDSTVGWPLDHTFPYYRKILPRNAIRYGYLFNSDDPAEERINERPHWSVVAKRQDRTAQPYLPSNLSADIPPEKIAGLTGQERALLEACGAERQR